MLDGILHPIDRPSLEERVDEIPSPGLQMQDEWPGERDRADDRAAGHPTTFDGAAAPGHRAPSRLGQHRAENLPYFPGLRKAERTDRPRATGAALGGSGGERSRVADPAVPVFESSDACSQTEGGGGRIGALHGEADAHAPGIVR